MFYRKKEEILYDGVIGLMVRIPPFQGGDPGSIPGLRTLFSPFLWKENGDIRRVTTGLNLMKVFFVERNK